MKTIDVLDDNTALLALTEAGQQTGESITLMCDGHPVADVVPRDTSSSKKRTKAEVFAEIDALRKTLRPFTMEEIQSAKEEGRR